MKRFSSRSPVRVLTTVFAVGALLSLTACNDDDEATGSSGADSSASDSDDTAGDDTAGDDADAGDDSGLVQDASGAGCLVGSWVADNEHMGGLFAGMADQAGFGGSMGAPTGKVVVTFGPGGEYEVDYQKWTMKMTQQGMTVTMTRDGSDTGTYTAGDDGALSVSETSMGSVMSIATPAGSQQVKSDPSTSSATFECNKDTAEITSEGVTGLMHRQ